MQLAVGYGCVATLPRASRVPKQSIVLLLQHNSKQTLDETPFNFLTVISKNVTFFDFLNFICI